MASIRVDGWRTGIRFDAAHFIPGHPKCGRLHGHTYALHAEVTGTVGRSGFVMDFGDVTRALRDMAERLDHRVLVQAKSPDAIVRIVNGSVEVAAAGKRYVVPEADALLLPIEFTTAENLVEYVADAVLGTVQFPPTVESIAVGIDESYGKGAWTTRLF